ncbi:MAG: hypothetical protein CENE_02075 [Candidatus Celerinatantimonas neptuna]|nr:MAG: hypothetical protein CENE_02075 [Candidatus Celerinatantimonas neptuna]
MNVVERLSVKSGILLAAHRGIWKNAPENSISAIEAAIEQGVEIVEIDAQLCQSGELVVIHDEMLDRTTSETGPVASFTADQLRKVCLREGAGGEKALVTDEHIPMLKEVLECVKGRIIVNIDAKRAEQLPAIVDFVEQLGAQADVIVKAVIDPFNPQLPDCLKDKPDIVFMPLLRSRKSRLVEDLQRLSELAPSCIELSFADIDGREAIDFDELLGAELLLEKMKARIWTNTLNCVSHPDFSDSKGLGDPDSVWGQLIRFGVSIIQTDESAFLKAYLDERFA